MKVRAFVAEIFAKQYWCFLIIDFQCIFDISAIMHLRSLQRWKITEWLWNFFETRSQNGPISVKWKHQSQLIFCILRLSHKHITFDILKKHPVKSYWHVVDLCYELVNPTDFPLPHLFSRNTEDTVQVHWQSWLLASVFCLVWSFQGLLYRNIVRWQPQPGQLYLIEISWFCT